MSSNEPSWADLLELDLPQPTPAAAPQPAAPVPAPPGAQAPVSLPLSPGAQSFAERLAAPARDHAFRYSGRPAAVPDLNNWQSRDLTAAREGATVTVLPPMYVNTGAKAPTLGSEIVAGARAAAKGVLLSWQGLGSLTRSQIIDALCSPNVDLPAEWAPEPLSTHAVLGRALSALNSEGRVCRAMRKEKGSTWRAKWVVGTVDGMASAIECDAFGRDTFGRVVLTAYLRVGEERDAYDLYGEEHLVERVRAQVESDLAAETLSSADVTAWLERLLRRHYCAVALGTSWYMPSGSNGHAVRFERLCYRLKSIGWGRSWMLPAIPVASSEELQEGLAAGLEDELAAVRADFAAQKGNRGAEAALSKVLAIRLRAGILSAHLGEAMLFEVVSAAEKLEAQIRLVMSDVSQRAALLEL